jgi:tRNA A37 threonylcarbamoyladenosine dehydratase
MTVGIVGLGGGGSMVAEQIAHLGVGRIVAIDFDVVRTHNLSRIVGATGGDARSGSSRPALLRGCSSRTRRRR